MKRRCRCALDAVEGAIVNGFTVTISTEDDGARVTTHVCVRRETGTRVTTRTIKGNSE